MLVRGCIHAVQHNRIAGRGSGRVFSHDIRLWADRIGENLHHLGRRGEIGKREIHFGLVRGHHPESHEVLVASHGPTRGAILREGVLH